VVDGRGQIYVNRSGFNPTAGEEFRPGFVFLVAADGSVRQVADDIAFPNGMAVTADNATLIVADSYRHSLVACRGRAGHDGPQHAPRSVRHKKADRVTGTKAYVSRGATGHRPGAAHECLAG
jgi:sugar lactone lactonase YvrE